jgi:hypothetical protein
MTNQTITLPSGKTVEYKTQVTAGLYLDLNDIPEHLTGTRLRKVAQHLVVQIGDKREQGAISREIEEMLTSDFAALSGALLEVIENEAKPHQEKKN